MSYEENVSEPGSLRGSTAGGLVQNSEASDSTKLDYQDVVKRSYAYEDNASLAASDYVPDDETAQKLSTGQFSETSSYTSNSSYKLNDYETDDMLSQAAPVNNAPVTFEKNWNEEFQQLLELKEGSDDESTDKFRKLAELAHDFCYAAQIYGKIIISEVGLLPHQKTIKPVDVGGRAGGEKYIVLNILFKFALDTEGLYGHDDAAAMKAADHELKGLINYYNCHTPGISFPLMALINYRGYRLVAISVLPIDKSTIIYGSHDGGQHVHAKKPDFNQKMIEAAKMLNLKGHIVGMQKKVMLYSAGDIEGHQGRDNRYYLIDFARVFPPQLKLVKDWRPRQLYELLRPELVQSNPVPLSSDALTGWGSQDRDNHMTHNKEVKDATLRLFVDIIPTFASTVDNLSKSELANFRFEEELHRNGINIRHLGHVRKQVKSVGVRKRILHICIARTMKDKISTKLRKKVREIRIPSEEPYKKVILNYLNKVLDSKSAFWLRKIKYQVQEKFPECLSETEMDLKTDLKFSSQDIYDLIEYFQQLTGVKMSNTALEELRDNPHSFRFVSTDLRLMEATVKHMNLIEHCSAVVLHSEAIKSQGREASRLFTLANEKFREALARAPNSVMTLFHWGKLLHNMALRHFDPSLLLRARNTDRLPRLISNTRNLLPQPPKPKIKLGERYALYNSESSLPPDDMLTGSEMSDAPDSPMSMRSLSNSSNSNATLSQSQFAKFSLDKSRALLSDDISLGDERRKFVDMDKAEEYFILAEEKFRRAIKLSSNFRPPKESLISLLYDFGDFLLENGKLKPFYQVKNIYARAKEKFSDLLSYDPTLYQSLYRKARYYASMFKKVDDFKSQTDYFNAAVTLFRALKKQDKSNEVLNFKYGLLMFRYYVACLRKDQITEDTKSLIQKAARSLVQAGKSNPKIVQQISTKIFGREFEDVKDFSSHLNFELFGLVDIGVFLTDINSAFKERFDSIRKLNLTGMFKNLESNEEVKFQNIFKACGNLTHLILDECKITDETMKFIGRYVPKLEHLSCRGCKQITMICITENERTKRMLMNSVSNNPEGVAAQRMVNSNANLLANLATTPTTPPSMHVTSPRERTATLPNSTSPPQQQGSGKKKRDANLSESAPEPDVISLLNSMNNVKTNRKDKQTSKSPRTEKDKDKSPRHEKDKDARASVASSAPSALNLSAVSATSNKTSPVSSPRDNKGSNDKSPRAMLGSQRLGPVQTSQSQPASSTQNASKVELDTIFRAAGNILSSSVKSFVEEKHEKDKHDKEKDKHDKDKEKDKHERRTSRETERENAALRGSRTSILSDPLARLGTSAVSDFIPKHQYPVKSWYFPPELTYLDLGNCPLLDSDWIATISYFTKLSYLSLAGDNKLTDDALIPVIYNCTKLSSLNVNDCHLLTSYSIQFLTKTPHLTGLSMGNCKNVFEDCIQQISRTCSQLVSLDISNIKDISDSTVKNIASKCPNLTTLKLSFCSQITDSSAKSLAKQVGKNLVELDLTACVHLTDQAIMTIAKVASKMRRLVLRQCSEITGAAMLELAKNCPLLEKLDISNCHRIDTIIEVLTACSKLSELNMESCFGLSFNCLKDLNKKLTSLVDFNWSQGNASNESLKVVAVCMPNVQTLLFNQCKKITDQGVHYLANLNNVKELYLDNTSITDAAIKSLAEGGSAGTMSVLSLQNPEKLTDESLDMMTKSFKVLKHLSISSNDITDQAIERLLLGCREVHELFIKNNILSKQSVHSLRDKFPNVRILVHTTLNM